MSQDGSAKILSLSKARKARARAERRKQSDANALRFGRSKDAKDAEDLREKKARRDLDQHARSDPEDDP